MHFYRRKLAGGERPVNTLRTKFAADQVGGEEIGLEVFPRARSSSLRRMAGEPQACHSG
jgi:hypothetical protein